MNRLKALGPGLLYAGAAIGVSHIVQSTRAGAYYGFVLIIAIVLAHLLKYPFFVIGPRYANASHETLISGYKKVGNWALALVFLLTFLTMFSVQAAVTVVTAGLAAKLTNLHWQPWIWSTVLLVVCFVILQVGKFNVLDRLMKVIMIVLAVSTVLAFLCSFGIDVKTYEEYKTVFSFSRPKDLEFLIAFVGWMPAPLEIAIWHSIWSVTKYKTKGRNDLKSENFDFNIGFYGTALLAICFLCLGANTLYGTGEPLPAQAGAYASKLVELYTKSLGSWSYYLILIAAFTTMFSTTLTCFDAMPKVMAEIFRIWTPQKTLIHKSWLWMLILGVGCISILVFFISSMAQMVTIATITSFLTAPFIAYISYRLIALLPESKVVWNNVEKKLALTGLSFLVFFSIFYLYSQFIM